MKKKIYAILAGTAIFAMAACSPAGGGGTAGGGAAADGGGGGGAAAAPAGNGGDAAAVDPDEIITLTFTNWETGMAAEVFSRHLEEFESLYPNIRVEQINMPDEYDTRLTAMIAAGQSPDIAVLESSTMLFPLATEGHLVNLLDFIYDDPQFHPDNLLPVLRYMYDENTMIGYGLGPQTIIMFYNPSLFDEAGVPHPPADYNNAWDWDTFVNHAKTLTADANGNNAHSPLFDYNNINQFGVNTGQWWPNWSGFVYSAGANFLTPDGTSLGLLQPAGVNALQNVVDLIHVHRVMPTPAFQGALPGMVERFITGRVAMEIGGQWSNMDLMNDEVDYAVAALPRMGDRAHTMIVFGAISMFDGDNVDETWQLFRFLYSIHNEMIMEQSGLWLPSNGLLFEDQYLDRWITDRHPPGYREAVVRPVLDGNAIPTHTATIRNFPRIQDIINPALDLAWSGELSVQEALEDIYETVQPLIEGWR